MMQAKAAEQGDVAMAPTELHHTYVPTPLM